MGGRESSDLIERVVILDHQFRKFDYWDLTMTKPLCPNKFELSFQFKAWNLNPESQPLLNCRIFALSVKESIKHLVIP